MTETNAVSKKRIVFVMNPISGTQGKRAILRYIHQLMDRERCDYQLVRTKYAGHATEIAKQAVDEGVDMVVAIGGDGTINEIAKALVHSKTALGIIPCGSGNGLARHLRIPMEPKAAVELLNSGKRLCIDYGKINGLPFFCTCGVGFDAFVSLKFADSGKRGLLTYLENTLHESLTYKPETYEIENEEGTQRYNAFLIACGNASQYGNNAYITPQASLTDGLMDVTIMEPFTVLDVPSLSFQLFNKTLDQNSRIKTFRARKIKIHRAKPGVLHYDGDPVMADENLEVEIIPQGLYVVASDEKVKGESLNLLQQISEYFSGLKPKGEEFIAKRQSHLFELNRTLLRKLSNKD
ncbi:MAG: diacylglycerol kinase family lipid kinase [Bacteroidaceae bacterium]|nr:diacylglycerol kinase family lipid kinase [Bacteroidaceae bacterium]